MGIVAAVDGDQVLFSTLDAVPQQDAAVDDGEQRNTVQSLVDEGSGGGLGVIILHGSQSCHLDGVLPCFTGGEVEILGGGAQLFAVDLGAVGVEDLQLVGAGTLDGVPLDGIGVDLHHGSGQLAAGGSGGPQGEQGGICLENHVLNIRNGQFFGVLGLADPPAGEGVAVTGGSRNVVQLAADGGHSGITLGLVTQVEVDGVLILTDNGFSPLGVDGGVGGDDLVAEAIELGAIGVGVPADEHAAVLLGISRLGNGLAVYNVNRSNLAAAVHIEVDLEGLLLQKAHGLVLVLQDHDAVLFLQRAGAVLVLDKVQLDAVVVDDALTGFVEARAGDHKYVALR